MPRTALEASEKLAKKFLDIDEEWRNKVDAADVSNTKALLVEVQKNEEANQEAKEMDEDLAEAKERYQTASAGYAEGTKMNRLKIKYALKRLKSLGG